MGLRNWFLKIMPLRIRDKVMAESQRWQTSCRNCGHASTIWDLGGLRGGAVGQKMIRTRCAACGRFTAHDVTYH